MLGYAVAIASLFFCYIFSRWNKKQACLKSERIVHTFPDMVFVLDRSLRIMKLYNPNLSILLAAPEKLIGTNLREYFSEAQICEFEKGAREALVFDKISEIEYSLSTGSEIRFFEARFLNIDGKLVTCAIRDITERKNRDITINRNQEFLKSILDNLPFPVMLKDIKDDFRYLYWNSECKKESGFPRETVPGKTDIDLYGEERGGYYRSIDEKVVAEGQLYTAQEDYVTLDGVLHNTIVYKNVINNDLYSWLLVVRRDITDFINIQNELKEVNQLNRLILDNSSAGFVFVGPDHIVKWENVGCNFSPAINLAYKKGSVCYKSVKGLEQICPDCILKKAIKSGKSERQDLVLDNVDIEVVATPVWEEGELKGGVLRIEDITEKKRIEKELRKAKEDAEKSDRLKSAFLANISHEIRTPLNAIVGFSELLCHSNDPVEQRKYIDIIQGNNEQLLQLISDILDIAKIETDTLEFIYSYVEVNQLFSELKETVTCKMFPEAGVEIVIKKCESHCLIYTERSRVLQVLIHFCSNAIKFTEKGKIIVGYEVREEEIYFYVSDTGIGIPVEKQELIFNRFVKLDSFKNGTGLGLAICKTIINRLNGKIGVESTPGNGATFWFSLPVRLVTE